MVAPLTAFPARSPPRLHAGAAASRRYQRRRPEKTPLYKIVAECLESWLEDHSAREPVAGYVEEEFREYLTCGLLCCGFARAVCTRCPQRFVVAFSCKRRGVRPSCNGFLAARPLTQGDLATLTERVRRRVIAFFKRQGFLDARAAADMLAWENSGVSIDASVRITLLDHDVPSYFQSLEHLLRYCARPPFALHRLSVIRDADGRIARIRSVMPRHKAADWVGPGRGRKSTRDAATGGDVHAGHAAGDCCGTQATPRSHDTARKSLGETDGTGRGGVCPPVPGVRRRHPPDLVTPKPVPIRKMLTHLGEPLEPPLRRLPGPGNPRADRPGTHPSATRPGPHATHRPENGNGSAIDRAVLNPLSAAAVKSLRDEFAGTVEPAQALAREVIDREHAVSGLVNAAYGLTPADIDLLWDTAPPRMPIAHRPAT